MSHTQKQASELWCPMVRVGVQPSSGGPSAINDPTTVNYHGSCIAETCAMWRWVDKPSQVYRVTAMCEDRFAETEPERPAGLNNTFVFVPCDENADAHWAEPEEVWLSRRRGYCGLAGRPEVM